MLGEVGSAAICWWNPVRRPWASAPALTRCTAIARYRPALSSSSRSDWSLIGCFHSSARATCTASAFGSCPEVLCSPNDPPVKGTCTRIRSSLIPAAAEAAIRA
jgi:hypothetical protein